MSKQQLSFLAESVSVATVLAIQLRHTQEGKKVSEFLQGVKVS